MGKERSIWKAILGASSHKIGREGRFSPSPPLPTSQQDISGHICLWLSPNGSNWGNLWQMPLYLGLEIACPDKLYSQVSSLSCTVQQDRARLKSFSQKIEMPCLDGSVVWDDIWQHCIFICTREFQQASAKFPSLITSSSQLPTEIHPFFFLMEPTWRTAAFSKGLHRRISTMTPSPGTTKNIRQHGLKSMTRVPVLTSEAAALGQPECYIKFGNYECLRNLQNGRTHFTDPTRKHFLKMYRIKLSLSMIRCKEIKGLWLLRLSWSALNKWTKQSFTQ